MFSVQNNVMTNDRTLLDSTLVEQLVLIHMNRKFIQYMGRRIPTCRQPNRFSREQRKGGGKRDQGTERGKRGEE